MATCTLNPVDIIERAKAARKRRLQELYVTGSRTRHATSSRLDGSRFAETEEGSGDSWDESISADPSSATPPPVGPSVPDEFHGSWERTEAAVNKRARVSVKVSTGSAAGPAPAFESGESSAGCSGHKRSQLLPMFSQAAASLGFGPSDLLTAVMLHDACQLRCRLGGACCHRDTVQRHVLALTCLFVAHKAKAARTATNSLSSDAFCQTLACLEGLSAVKGCMLERQLDWVSRLFPSLHLPASGNMFTLNLDIALRLLRNLWSLLIRDGNSASQARYLAAFVLQLRTTAFGRANVPPSIVAAAADVAVRGVKSTRKQDLLRAFALMSSASRKPHHTSVKVPLARRVVALPADSEASAAAMAAAAGVLTDLANSPTTTAVAARSLDI
ncbi:hypothetical protein CLOM_g7465 [Closterium sp. NIES-68]|nr:hypothetical protein CLOM_g7465 [Closterium sp. NIES-68]GJP71729.1 hypothetical protein CLOP_g2530 [Closterium sp. NIES-67]